MKLDFDTMRNLFRTEPVIADILQRKTIYREIRKQCKTPQDLWIKRGWWRKIEIEIAKHSNPIGRMVKASQMMRLELTKLNNALNGD